MNRVSFLFIFQFIVFLSTSCTKEKYNEFEKSTTKKIRVSITPMGYEYNIYYNEPMQGTLVLNDIKKNKLEYDIVNGENNLIIPFGFYTAKIKNFEGCAQNSFEILSIGGNKETVQNVNISKLTNINVKIVDTYVYPSGYLYFNMIVDSIPGYYKGVIWGTNVLNPQEEDINFLYQSFFSIYNSSHIFFGGLNDKEAIYRYYNVTVEPFNGYREEVVYNDWYEYKAK